MYFTRNNIEDGKVKKDEKEVVRMKIFHSVKGDNLWGIEIPFPFNSDKYSCMHPALSADGKVLYFSSDMAVKVEWISGRRIGTAMTWTNPVNMGTAANTPDGFPLIPRRKCIDVFIRWFTWNWRLGSFRNERQQT